MATPPPQELLARAYQMARGGDFSSAERLLTPLCRGDGPAGAFHLRAVSRHRLGRLDDAWQDMERALALAPQEGAFHLDAGNLLDDRGDPDAAIHAYRRAQEGMPNGNLGWRNAARILRRLGRLDEAREALQKALAIDPRDVAACRALGAVLLALARPAEAALHLDEALCTDTNHAATLAARARAEAEKGGDALPFYDRARQAAPDDPAIATGRAIALHEQGASEAALKDLQGALRRWPDNGDIHRSLAELRWQLGDREGFDRDVRLYLVDHPDDRRMWNLHLTLLSRAQRHQTILDRAASARSACGDAGFVDAFAAVAASELGQAQTADALFQRVGYRASPSLRAARLRHLLRNGRAEEAIAVVDEEEQPASREEIAYVALAWRATGDRRAEHFEAHESLIRTVDLGVTNGDRDVLRPLLRRLHRASHAPLAQSVRNGTQTDGQLFALESPPLQQLRAMIQLAVADYVSGLAELPRDHPMAELARRRWRIVGSWSVRLTGGGFHVSHCHPQGLVSSALHIDVPPEDPGQLQLGEPPAELGLELTSYRHVVPRTGQLILFPSTMWHGTLPFRAGERLSIAFDIL